MTDGQIAFSNQTHKFPVLDYYNGTKFYIGTEIVNIVDF